MRNAKRAGSAILVALIFSGRASALSIDLTEITPGNAFAAGLGLAGPAPLLAGGGELASTFQAAASLWEIAILDSYTVNLQLGWQSLSAGTLGVHVLAGQGGSPNRETSGVIPLTTTER
jgi:hypothetical protein